MWHIRYYVTFYATLFWDWPMRRCISAPGYRRGSFAALAAWAHLNADDAARKRLPLWLCFRRDKFLNHFE